MKIEQSDLDSFLEHSKQAAKYEKKISDRINHILREIFPKAFKGFKLGWWDYSTYNYESEEDGSLSYAWSGDSINLRCEWDSAPEDYKDWLSETIGYFPEKYLTMPDSEIESELLDMLRRVDEEVRQEEEAKRLAKEKKKQAKEAALSKLTKEERKALGLK